MVKYKYDVESECFRRVDNRGKPLWVNVTEAQSIALKLDLGYSITQIEGKVSLANPQGTVTTIRSFIKNYRAGNIEIPSDAPLPVRAFDEMSDSSRIDNLEKRVERLEDIFYGTEEFDILGKVKSWIKRE